MNEDQKRLMRKQVKVLFVLAGVVGTTLVLTGKLHTNVYLFVATYLVFYFILFGLKKR